MSTAAAALVLPGQPLYTLASSTSSSSLQQPAEAGKGAFSREATIYSSAIGSYSKSKSKAKDGITSIITVTGKESSTNVVPEIGSTILGTVVRLTRLQAVLNIISVDGRACQNDWQGIIRLNDIRQTALDKLKIWDCFRPGDVVRASVISLGDVRSYYLSTAKNELGVVFARHSDTGARLEPVSWTEMVDSATGLREMRKVAGPPSSAEASASA